MTYEEFENYTNSILFIFTKQVPTTPYKMPETKYGAVAAMEHPYFKGCEYHISDQMHADNRGLAIMLRMHVTAARVPYESHRDHHRHVAWGI